MRKSWLLVVTFVASVFTSPLSYASRITPSELFEGCKVPERRAFELNEAINPCDDFFGHVCSKTISSFTLPPERNRWVFSFTDLDERLLSARTNFLLKLKTATPKEPRARAMRDYYLACMNEKATATEEKSKVETLKALVAGMDTREKFIEEAATKITAPHFTLIGFETDSDLNHPDHYSVEFESGASTLPEKTYYDKPEVVEAFQKVVGLYFKTIGMSDPELRAKRVVEFEKAYAKVDLLPKEYRKRSSEPHYVARAEFQKQYPLFALDSFLKRVPESTPLGVLAPEVLGHIHEQLKSANLDTLKDVLLFRRGVGYLDQAYPDFFNAWFSFRHQFLGGPEKRRPLEQRCAERIRGAFGKELDSELISILFPKFPEPKLKNLVSQVRGAILEQLKENQWLTKEARSEAEKKIRSAKLYLVKPHNAREWDFNPIGKYSTETPYANSEELSKLLIEKSLNELQGPRNREKWEMGPLTLNAYYSPPDNHFVLLQGILQFPFYDPKGSEIENFGGIGMVIGHELGHSIDDHGSQFDSTGKIRDWMKTEDHEAFKKRTEVFITQFNGIGHDGKLTLGENIGDHVGLRAAYRAAFHGKKSSLQDQKRFFTSFARVWCGMMLPKTRENLLKTDPHSLGEARVNQQVMHIDGFQEAYGCKKGNALYLDPEKRVKVW